MDGCKEDELGEDASHLMCDMFQVHVATEGCIYLDAISKLMTQSGDDDDGSPDDSDGNDAWNKVNHDPLSLAQHDQIDDPLRPTSQHQNNIIEKDIEWDTSLLLLLPLRLGIQSISTCNYGSTLVKLLSFPQSVGMLGGTPRHALWFYGADAVEPPSPDDNDKESSEDGRGGWYGLDPHTVQMAPRGTRILLESNSSQDNTETNAAKLNESPSPTHYQWQVQLTDTYLRSLHFSPTTSHPNHQRSIPLSKLDPSCALGFYIRDHSDFLTFQRLIGVLSREHCRPNRLPEIVTVLEKTPNYEVDVSSAMKGMMMGKGQGDEGVGSMVDDLDGFSMQSDEENGVHEEEEEDDDDDFVLI
mmetsp:Transcript_409/g.901  ORF Transcript_409/g.901 Transcript_409/m.901 type:complete len:357 (-) Transcript_409:483-1553(-)|eukprot:CAMPEP_0201878854 /NCGR_PEP_ID=MMETSP0902-20130614/9906_1 /ASSEMBLY_ACC=CAM_ASM_000551 /TAXON_ID=420261 /ORGANISM="Thalassiosira antarctica, Strain CCMP982" /LENGTH=356 /DNA_ID=CAMNT_0048406567 /DNA_START=386 /DNA_END=1456 /DNA_ORIENTATION=+